MQRRIAQAALAATVVLTLTLPTQAAVKNWTGAIDTKWSTAGNWDPPGTPATGDTLFLTPANDITVVNDLPSTTHLWEVRQIPYYSSGPTRTPTIVITGNALTVGYALTGVYIHMAVDVTINDGTYGLLGAARLHMQNLHVANGTPVTIGNYTEISSISGAGTLNGGFRLIGDSSFTGPFNLQFRSSIGGSAPGMTVVVKNQPYGPATLRGTGSMGDTTVYGILDPGLDPCTDAYCVSSPGSATYGHTIGTLTFGDLAIVDKNAETVIDVGSSSDVLSAKSVTLNGALTLFAPSPVPAGSTFRIIDNRGPGPVAGTFNGLPEGALVTPPGGKSVYTISYAGGDGNDVTLTARGHGTVTLSSPDTYGKPGSPVPVTVRVVFDGPTPNPPGQVSLTFNDFPPTTVTLDGSGQATVPLTLRAGLNYVSASYATMGIYDGSTGWLELFGGKRTPALAATARPEPASFGEPVTLAATLKNVSSPTGAVTVTEGANLLGGAAVTGDTVGVLLPSLAPGTHTFTVRYSGDDMHESATATATARVSASVTGLTYAQPDSSRLTLDLTVPNGAGPFPLIVALETDSWSVMPKTSTLALREVSRGWAVATVRFRTSFPAQIRDLKAAVRWLRANAVRYHLQPNRVVAWGIGAAGGHLAALLGTSGDVAALDDPAEDAADFSSHVQGVIDWSGADDLTSFGTCGGATRFEAGSLGGSAVPSTYASSDDPPFLLMHGTSDCNVDAAAPAALAAALRGNGVDTTLIVVDGAAGSGSAWSSTVVSKAVDDFLDLKVKPPTSRRRAATRP